MKLYEETARHFSTPEVSKRLTAMGAVLDIRTPDEMRKYIPQEIAKWSKVAVEAGMPREVQ
jgi:tripartite-type tricarboxylate transporter receptor subunit TctC